MLGCTKKAVKTLVVSKLNRKFAAKTIIMKSYGRKIIDYIFGKRSDCPAIHYECERKIQADSDQAIFECLRLGYPLNDMEITGKAREMQRKRNVVG